MRQGGQTEMHIPCSTNLLALGKDIPSVTDIGSDRADVW